VSLQGGAIVAVLLSGTSRVVALTIDPGGAVSSMDALALPGAVREAPRFFSRDLAPHGDSGLLAATSEGVFSIQIRVEAGIQLDLQSTFEGASLRGPVQAVTGPP
jgi:hypothetical protein